MGILMNTLQMKALHYCLKENNFCLIVGIAIIFLSVKKAHPYSTKYLDNLPGGLRDSSKVFWESREIKEGLCWNIKSIG